MRTYYAFFIFCNNFLKVIESSYPYESTVLCECDDFVEYLEGVIPILRQKDGPLLFPLTSESM